MPAIVHYEVYTQDIRGWGLHARYIGSEREAAIEDAKHVESTLRQAVRVVRETYYPENNYSEDAVVYIGRVKPRSDQGPVPTRLRGKTGPRKGLNSSPMSTEELEAFLGPKRPEAAGKSYAADVVFRIIMVMLASLAMAMIGTGLVSLLVSQSGMPQATASLISFLIFLSLFLLTAVPLTMNYVPLDWLQKTVPSASPAPNKGTPHAAVKPAVEALAEEMEASAPKGAPPESSSSDVDNGSSAEAKEADGKEEKDSNKSQNRDILAGMVIPGETAEDEDIPPFLPQPLEALSPTTVTEADATKAEAAKKAETLSPPPPPPPAPQHPAKATAEEPIVPVPSAHFDQCRLTVMKFLGGVVNAIKAIHPQLDTYNKFGVNLYLAGACEVLAQRQALEARESSDLLREAVEVIGTRSEQAKHLISRLDGYRKEPRYRDMIAAGRKAMDAHLSGERDPFTEIGGILKAWNTPQSRQISAATVTILFTDMVGSTDMTHQIGDAAAQDVIRAHNTIVRTALLRHKGKEIKHTGDGIMASFDNANDAIEASIQIQQYAFDHSTKWQKLPLRLRIGMNTGEPIIEENDYFGATVQVAARICAAAGVDQIWIGAATYDHLPATTKAKLFDHGTHKLRGVRDEQRLYEVVWNDARTAELEAIRAFREGEENAPTASSTAATIEKVKPAPRSKSSKKKS